MHHEILVVEDGKDWQVCHGKVKGKIHNNFYAPILILRKFPTIYW